MDSDHVATTARLIAARATRRLGLRALVAGLALPATALPAAAKPGNRKRPRKRCPACPKGTIKLANGACARKCDPGSASGAGCSCGFNLAGTGQYVLTPVINDCAEIPTVCANSGDCARGQACVDALCPGNRRCIALCV